MVELMTLQNLKTSIENKTFRPTSLILLSEDKFIPLQYINAIQKDLGFSITYIEDLSVISPDIEDIFSIGTQDINTDIIVFNTDLVDFSNDILYNKDNIIIITNKIDKSSKEYYKNIIIEVPKLVEWQVKDMVYSMGSGIEGKYLDWLIKNCNSDVYRLYNEISKLSLFNEADRESLFLEMSAEGAFEDLSANTIFNFTNAILKKDIKSLKTIFEEIDNIDINDFGLLTILYNNFLNVINIQLGTNPTPDSLGLSTKQFNAIKYNCGYYSQQQLISVFNMLTDLDRKIKSGEFPTSIMRDYMIMSILNS